MPTIKTTPYRDALPPLTTEERAALRASIAQYGVRNACLATEDGRLLDGHNRLEMEPSAPVAYLPGSADWTDGECLAFIYRCNRERRNLSPEQKRAVRKKERDTAKALRQEDPQRWTQERLAEAFGVTQQSVSEWFTTNTNSCNSCDARVKIPATQHSLILDRIVAGESQEQVANEIPFCQAQAETGRIHSSPIRKEESRVIATTETSDFIALTEVPSRYPMSERTIYRLVKQKRLRVYRRTGSKRNYLRREDLEQLLVMQPIEDI